MRLAALLCAALAGCSATTDDPCAGHDGACLGLRVEGPAISVDQLAVRMLGAAHLDGSTPPQPGPLEPLPVTTAVYLPDTTGAVQLVVEGKAAGRVLARGTATAQLTPGQHQSITVTLVAEAADGGTDGGAPDLTVTDAMVPDDLASGDQAMPPLDLLPPGDLTLPPDLTPPPPRYVFIANSVTGAGVAGIAGADTKCQQAATAAGLPGTYKAILATNGGTDPSTRIVLNQGRTIILTTGTVVATDSTFFNTTHAARIDRMANRDPATDSCVWTDFTALGADANAGDCTGWTSDSGNGGVGTVLAQDTTWAQQAATLCSYTCHIYCIQQ